MMQTMAHCANCQSPKEKKELGRGTRLRKEDYNYALMEEPWMIPNLSIKLYNHRFLWQVRSTIGTMLKIDRGTSIHSCGKFARIYVELDLSKKFVLCISVLENVLNIETSTVIDLIYAWRRQKITMFRLKLMPGMVVTKEQHR
ncbi:hypothetical protein Ahy_B07g087981 [Arachis hypogaea]|uniref:Uncharacterized protein n=1 Tax=Arachis hypogaea TaxID=3818 RepID=A0A444YDF2_ARAHY|nr:hypothetical protein Ahy_B07g087981 [Arachis hypogaea]